MANTVAWMIQPHFQPLPLFPFQLGMASDTVQREKTFLFVLLKWCLGCETIPVAMKETSKESETSLLALLGPWISANNNQLRILHLLWKTTPFTIKTLNSGFLTHTAKSIPHWYIYRLHCSWDCPRDTCLQRSCLPITTGSCFLFPGYNEFLGVLMLLFSVFHLSLHKSKLGNIQGAFPSSSSPFLLLAPKC